MYPAQMYPLIETSSGQEQYNVTWSTTSGQLYIVSFVVQLLERWRGKSYIAMPGILVLFVVIVVVVVV